MSTYASAERQIWRGRVLVALGSHSTADRDDEADRENRCDRSYNDEEQQHPRVDHDPNGSPAPVAERQSWRSIRIGGALLGRSGRPARFSHAGLIAPRSRASAFVSENALAFHAPRAD
jgi:hypothetical protein